MKNILITFLLASFFSSYGQLIDPQDMGQVTADELKMKFYEKDSSAAAVVLKEEYFTYYNPTKKNAFTKHFYVRMKIFKRSGYKHATLSIPFLKSSRIKDIEAITYNYGSDGSILKTEVDPKDIIKERSSKNVKRKAFAMPNVKVGSVIEYKFTLKHSGGYGIYDWVIQTDIPKLKSIYKAHVPVDLRSRLIGYILPDINEFYFKKNCLGNKGCNFAHIEYDHMPAFIEQPYLTSKWNYMTRLSFERQYYNSDIKGPNREWKALDRSFQKYYEKEMNNTSFLKKQLPNDVLTLTDPKVKAEKIYSFIRDHFNVSSDADGNLIKDFNAKTASARNINISLYNALKAGGVPNVKLALLSTRSNGFVTSFHPSITDFNYTLVRLEMNGKIHLLDATDKNLPFGMIPFNCLTNKVRVLDHVNGSYWEKLKPLKNNSIKVKATLKMDENGNITGKKTVTRNGYHALFKRATISQKTSEEEYLESEEAKYPVIEIANYNNDNLNNVNVPFQEVFELDAEEVSSINIAGLLGLMKENPLELDNRLYPVDYGYQRKGTFLLNIELPSNYEVKNLPQSAVFKLTDNDASYICKVSQIDNNLSIYIRSQIKNTVFLKDDYSELRTFYEKIVNTQNTEIEFHQK
jgi:hypothetical protein